MRLKRKMSKKKAICNSLMFWWLLFFAHHYFFRRPYRNYELTSKLRHFVRETSGRSDWESPQYSYWLQTLLKINSSYDAKGREKRDHRFRLGGIPCTNSEMHTTIDSGRVRNVGGTMKRKSLSTYNGNYVCWYDV